jgi:hypothetical protein
LVPTFLKSAQIAENLTPHGSNWTLGGRQRHPGTRLVDWGYNSIPIARSRIAGSKSLTRNLAPFQHLAPIQLRHDEPIFSDLSNRIRIAISIREQVAIQVLTIASAQGCRHHKVENVMGYLPEHLKAQVKAALRGAFLLPAEEGMARLEKRKRQLRAVLSSAVD